MNVNLIFKAHTNPNTMVWVDSNMYVCLIFDFNSNIIPELYPFIEYKGLKHH